MTREKAALLAREMIKLTLNERENTLNALDTEARILVIEEMYKLKGDIPPGMIPNCS